MLGLLAFKRHSYLLDLTCMRRFGTILTIGIYWLHRTSTSVLHARNLSQHLQAEHGARHAHDLGRRFAEMGSSKVGCRGNDAS